MCNNATRKPGDCIRCSRPRLAKRSWRRESSHGVIIKQASGNSSALETDCSFLYCFILDTIWKSRHMLRPPSKRFTIKHSQEPRSTDSHRVHIPFIFQSCQKISSHVVRYQVRENGQREGSENKGLCYRSLITCT